MNLLPLLTSLFKLSSLLPLTKLIASDVCTSRDMLDLNSTFHISLQAYTSFLAFLYCSKSPSLIRLLTLLSQSFVPYFFRVYSLKLFYIFSISRTISRDISPGLYILPSILVLFQVAFTHPSPHSSFSVFRPVFFQSLFLETILLFFDLSDDFERYFSGFFVNRLLRGELLSVIDLLDGLQLFLY